MNDKLRTRLWRSTWLGRQVDTPIEGLMHIGLWVMMFSGGWMVGAAREEFVTAGILFLVGGVIGCAAQLAVALSD